MSCIKNEFTPAGAFEQRLNILKRDIMHYIEDHIEENSFIDLTIWPSNEEEEDYSRNIRLFRAGNDFFINEFGDDLSLEDFGLEYLLEVAKQIQDKE